MFRIMRFIGLATYFFWGVYVSKSQNMLRCSVAYACPHGFTAWPDARVEVKVEGRRAY